jgi:hypothetical protein
MSARLAKWLGRWPVCIAFGIIATVMFVWLVPNGVDTITAGRTTAPKILDEYYLTWTAQDAQQLFGAIGPAGRLAYQHFYLTLDFWFPVLSLTIFYTSLLSLAFPQGRRLARVNLLPLLMYASDIGENLNHFVMAGTYPQLANWQLLVGPYISLLKYVLITFLPLLALIGFGLNRKLFSAKGRVQ